MALGSAAGVFDAGKTGRKDSPPLDERDDEPEAIERVGDLLAGVSQGDDHAARVFDRRHLGGQFRVDVEQDPRTWERAPP